MASADTGSAAREPRRLLLSREPKRQSSRPWPNFPRKQSHGPRADRSGGHQKRQIDPRLADAPRDLFHRRQQPPGAAHQAETVMIFGQTPDDVLGLELAQALDRKHQVDVPMRIGPVVGLM